VAASPPDSVSGTLPADDGLESHDTGAGFPLTSSRRLRRAEVASAARGMAKARTDEGVWASAWRLLSCDG
jgi:hypothetical protein